VVRPVFVLLVATSQQVQPASACGYIAARSLYIAARSLLDLLA